MFVPGYWPRRFFPALYFPGGPAPAPPGGPATLRVVVIGVARSARVTAVVGPAMLHADKGIGISHTVSGPGMREIKVVGPATS